MITIGAFQQPLINSAQSPPLYASPSLFPQLLPSLSHPNPSNQTDLLLPAPRDLWAHIQNRPLSSPPARANRLNPTLVLSSSSLSPFFFLFSPSDCKLPTSLPNPSNHKPQLKPSSPPPLLPLLLLNLTLSATSTPSTIITESSATRSPSPAPSPLCFAASPMPLTMTRCCKRRR